MATAKLLAFAHLTRARAYAGFKHKGRSHKRKARASKPHNAPSRGDTPQSQSWWLRALVLKPPLATLGTCEQPGEGLSGIWAMPSVMTNRRRYTCKGQHLSVEACSEVVVGRREAVEAVLETLREDDEFVLYRGGHSNQPGSPSVLLLAPASMQPARATLTKLEYEYSLRDELDSAWAVRPLALSEQRGQTMLVLEDPGGEILDRFLPGPMEMTRFLRFGRYRDRAQRVAPEKLVHKDVKPEKSLRESRDGSGSADGVWDRFAPSP